jgi:hypothetical protein
MILTFTGVFGSAISLDLQARLGERVELECFQFVVPPIEFRLVRNGTPLQDWQVGNTDLYDLQHGPGIREWERGEHRFINDLDHRHDVYTCGVLSSDLVMETRGLAGQFLLLAWPRMSTC